jgi:hypothetical protein
LANPVILLFKKICFKSGLFFLFILLAGCSTFAPFNQPSPHTHHQKSIVPKHYTKVCGYKTTRGIAVVRQHNDKFTKFNFYPGDWHLQLNNKETRTKLGNRTLHEGEEIKAKLLEPISGHCKSIDLDFNADIL